MQDQSPEDEIRRSRRRESNNVAAEKCHNKKKKETMNLFSEREIVERANVCYKEEIAKLEAEQRQLMHILANHQTVCTLGTNTSDSLNYWTLSKSNSCASFPTNNTLLDEDIEDIKEDTEVIVMVDVEEKVQRSEYLSQSSSRFSTGEQHVTSYTNLAYQGHSFSSGYYDSACAAV